MFFRFVFQTFSHPFQKHWTAYLLLSRTLLFFTKEGGHSSELSQKHISSPLGETSFPKFFLFSLPGNFFSKSASEGEVTLSARILKSEITALVYGHTLLRYIKEYRLGEKGKPPKRDPYRIHKKCGIGNTEVWPETAEQTDVRITAEGENISTLQVDLHLAPPQVGMDTNSVHSLRTGGVAVSTSVMGCPQRKRGERRAESAPLRDQPHSAWGGCGESYQTPELGILGGLSISPPVSCDPMELPNQARTPSSWDSR